MKKGRVRDWQPARWRMIHSRPLLSVPEREKWESHKWEVRPTNECPTHGTFGARMSDCNASQFYEVKGWGRWLMCEHEILTD